MRKSRQVVLAVVVLAAAFVLAGCSMKIGWISTSSRASMKARFYYFDGTQDKDVRLAAGDTLVVDYGISLKKGSLIILLDGPQGEVIREVGEVGDNSGTISFEAPVAGDYRISLVGESARGTYDVKWSIEKAR
ncbi:MAG: hypothetical protein ACM3WU_06335 [Bacillota bacterium]